ncbi:hypothetical protein ACIRLA_28900 [Streptomyces sp. NPDC102364]|uniref:hypothetical protein n=1 Tax=Streptomyces sp. NPDC102364 TaxID=3366161 RepID=UPI00381853AF
MTEPSRGRPRKLPESDLELLKLEAAGHTHREIGAKFGVSRQAVTLRFNQMGEYVQAARKDVSAVLPWDLSQHPASSKLKDSEAYIGLRAFVRQRLGLELSARGQLSLKTFLNHVRAGEILSLHAVHGFEWEPWDSARDGDIVIRWPEGVPRDKNAELLTRTD